MAKKIPEYPLAEVLEVKKRRVENAEAEVRKKEAELEKEKEKLAQAEAARDKVLHHKQDKLAQLRAFMDEGCTTPDIEKCRVYLKVVEVKLAEEEAKVVKQAEQVEIAKKNLELAKQELVMRRKEVDKVLTHREEWTKEVRKEFEAEEAREQDELGSVIYLTKKRKREE